VDEDATLGAPTTADEHAVSHPYVAGVELGGRYRLIAPLGKGGMGEVWEAEHLELRRTVAIKLVRADELDVRLAQRLRREAEIVARLEHPSIVRVTDVGETQDGRPYVVMDRLRGRPLSGLLRERGRLPWTQARDIAVQICAGLACAHAAGVIHRDLKPSNVFVLDDPHGRLPIAIIDFGLAKATVLGPRDRSLTKSGMVFGTPAYMPPEQVRGETLDGRADLYAAGAILHEMLVGEPPFVRATAAELLYCQLFETVPSVLARVPDVPPDLAALVARCLCKDPAMRPANADALRVELVGAGTGKGATVVPRDTIPMPTAELQARYAVHPIPIAPPSGRPRSSRVWIAPVVALGLVLAGGVGTMALTRWRHDAEPAPVEPSAVEPTPVEPTPVEVAAPPVSPTIERPPAVSPSPSVTPPLPEPAAVEPTKAGAAPTKKATRPKRTPSTTTAPGSVPSEPVPPVEQGPGVPKKDGEIYSDFFPEK